ncbi:MAG: hypothetical protein NC324_01925 [Bacteroides sp.]|nr:hypothetical protein [Bacteroides sp.]
MAIGEKMRRFFTNVGKQLKEEPFQQEQEKPSAMEQEKQTSMEPERLSVSEAEKPIETKKMENAGKEKELPLKRYTDAIGKQEALISAIRNALASNYRGLFPDFSNKHLLVWIKDNVFYSSIDADIFVTELERSLYDEQGYSFDKIKLREGIPEKITVVPKFPGISLQIKEFQPSRAIRRATISISGNNGSLMQDGYVLDAEEIMNLPNCRYNIGIGLHPQMDDGRYRENHIAVDDNPDSPQFYRNRYVSRAHAYITYNENYGFMLRVERGGTRIAQKRTHLYRGGEQRELDTPLLAEPLQDGDCIVLSKNVFLLFKQDKNKEDGD